MCGYNDDGCPDAVKAQILADPRGALKRMADRRRSVNADRPDRSKANVPPDVVGEIIKSARLQMAALRRVLVNISPEGMDCHKDALEELEASLLALRAMIRRLFSPGKKEAAQSDG